ncbi:MAG: methionine gamma-lyase family protein, partial [Bacilli bacterium]|nr:methionine gamma-lyase family protein [Bacilli bacterium]
MVVDIMDREDIIKLVDSCEEKCLDEFKKIDKICEYNSYKVLDSFHKNNLLESHFNS